ncbi:L,D-transpeptidase family protein [Proteobacteria bacterium 005FR1]|nr:L,D-transpeptidase family protein [Proteobacteria bacterium 005FR1]
MQFRSDILSFMIFGRQLPRFFRYAFQVPVLALLVASGATAATYKIPGLDSSVVGEIQKATVEKDDTLMDIARRYGVGHIEIRAANPAVNIWVPGPGAEITIPSQYILPDTPREGIVINRSEMRLYYFHHDAGTGDLLVTTHAMGIGRDDRQTPLGEGKVTMKLHKPAWYPTPEVHADYAAQGKSLPSVIPAGPENPLGEYAMVLDLPGLLIHGTNRPDGIGMLVSQGCMRLYPESIKSLVGQVSVGTPVRIIDEPIKVALVDGLLVLEVHKPVYPLGGDDLEDRTDFQQAVTAKVNQVLRREQEKLDGWVDWKLIDRVAERASGIPTVVSRR